MIEEYKNIQEFIDLFEISNLGNIKNKKTKNILKKCINPNGYYVVSTKPYINSRKSKIIKIHREVAKAFILNPENKPQVNHIDGNKLNNRVDNLEWVTAKENMIHAMNTGLFYCKGKKIKLLSNSEVNYIREKYKPRDKQFSSKKLCEIFNIDRKTLYNIVIKKTYTEGLI
jgi:hypothetical protein